MVDYDLLERTVNEINIPDAIVFRAPTPRMPVASRDFEMLSDSYSFYLGRALFDSVYEGVSLPLIRFAVTMSESVPYREDVRIPMKDFNFLDWEDILKGVLDKKRQVSEAVNGKTNIEKRIAIARAKNRDHLLEMQIAAVERHSREQEHIRNMIELEGGYTIELN